MVLLTIALPLSFLFSCFREKNEMIDVFFDPQTYSTIIKTNVETYISDSGITRYKIIAATWLIFGKASEPYWHFPDGVFLEKFDSLFNVEASVQADVAYYYQRRKLWQLDGNVDITNREGLRFQTEQFFWSEQEQEFPFFSDSLVTITEQPDIRQKSIGFRGNRDLTYYEFPQPSGDFEVEL